MDAKDSTAKKGVLNVGNLTDTPATFFAGYADKVNTTLASFDWSGVVSLVDDMHRAWMNGNQVFMCGNGGSAGNAIHLVNDLVYGIAKTSGGGMRAIALSANTSVMTCLANDLGYDKVFCEQLAVQGRPGDILIAMSGSGNSPNIVSVLERARVMGIRSFAILGYTGGKSKEIADVAIHFPIHDMQIAEDMQLIVGHMVVQWLYHNRPMA